MTPRQHDVLAYLQRYYRAWGLMPTRLEIGTALGISRPTAEQHLQALQRKGHLVLTKQWRGIALKR
jgi:repressor LexA